MSKPVPKSRMGILPQEERMAIIEGARKLGLDPYEFGEFAVFGLFWSLSDRKSVV